MLGTIAPVIEQTFAGAGDIARIACAVTGPDGLAGTPRPPSEMALRALELALREVLATVLDFCGPQNGNDGAVELWVEPTLAVVSVRYAGPPLPDWLLTNWDRGERPAVIGPPAAVGWGWLLVREAVEGVTQLPTRRGSLLLLERRL